MHPEEVLAADIGATKTNMAVLRWDENRFSPGKQATYPTKTFASIETMIREFLGNDRMPAKVCLAVAGPVKQNKVNLTNVHWQIDGQQLSDHYRKPVLLINDLEATAYGLAVLEGRDVHLVHEGEKDEGNVAIIAPGTGLGEAGLYFTDGSYYPFATEGGHCSFAPRTDTDMELGRFIQKSFGHVSWERVVSGPGICTLYDFLRYEKEREEPAWIREKMLLHDKATVITSNAGECALCKEALDLFLRYLAEESANLVLKLKATGGLFIAGGIVPHLLPFLHEGDFLKWFSNCGRMKSFLQAVPVQVVLNTKAPLLGAACFGIGSDR